METTMTAKRVTIREPFTTKVENRLAKLDRYFGEGAKANITASREGNRVTVEVTIKYRDLVFRSERTNKQMYVAFADATDIIEKQIIKNKGKLGARIKKVEKPVEEFVDIEEDDDYKVVREKTVSGKPITLDEAIMRMNLVDHDFYVFRNADSNRIEVVYKRTDGNYGIIIPE